MKITSSVEYSTRLMVSLARSGPAKLSAERLSEIENIPVDYVTQLLQRLRRAGLVESSRGPVGGYTLAREAGTITLGDVIRGVDGRIFEEVCGKYETGKKDCGQQTACGLSPVWQGLGGMLDDYFDNISLSRFTSPSPGAEPAGRSLKDTSFEL